MSENFNTDCLCTFQTLSQHFPNTQVLCPIRSSQQAPVKWMALGFPCCVHELGPPRWRWSSAVQAGSPAVPGSAYRTKVAKEQTKEQVTWHLTWTKMPKNTQNAHDSHDVHAIRMIYDDLWWFMMIYAKSDFAWFCWGCSIRSNPKLYGCQAYSSLIIF